LYEDIFIKKINIQMKEQGLTAKELCQRSGVSNSFLSEIFSKRANPSLKTMSSLARALGVPLPFLLEPDDSQATRLSHPQSNLPKGFKWVGCVLPEHQAYMVKNWVKTNQKKNLEVIKENTRDKERSNREEDRETKANKKRRQSKPQSS
jgi:transcriptional regulator with XRE-family HTH domain